MPPIPPASYMAPVPRIGRRDVFLARQHRLRWLRLLCALSMLHAVTAAAVDYTDIWYTPAEPGWGVNLVQSDSFMFATFFVFAQGGTPTWYTGQLNRDGAGKFNGALYASTGTYFAAPWVASASNTIAAGTVSFEPASGSATAGTLVYTVNGVGTVSKSIQRQTLTRIPLGGLYAGGQTGTYAGCSNSSNNGDYVDRYDLEVTHLSGGTATFRFKYTTGLVCTLSGAIEQHGQLYRMPSAAYACSDGLDTTATVYEIKATGQGVEGRFDAPSIGGGCREQGRFAAVL